MKSIEKGVGEMERRKKKLGSLVMKKKNPFAHRMCTKVLTPIVS